MQKSDKDLNNTLLQESWQRPTRPSRPNSEPPSTPPKSDSNSEQETIREDTPSQ